MFYDNTSPWLVRSLHMLFAGGFMLERLPPSYDSTPSIRREATRLRNSRSPRDTVTPGAGFQNYGHAERVRPLPSLLAALGVSRSIANIISDMRFACFSSYY